MEILIPADVCRVRNILLLNIVESGSVTKQHFYYLHDNLSIVQRLGITLIHGNAFKSILIIHTHRLLATHLSVL